MGNGEIATGFSRKTSCCIEGSAKMFQILLCDDDETFLKNLRKQVENSLDLLGQAAKIYAYKSMNEISPSILAGCDLAFLDIDFEHTRHNGIDIARKLREVRKDAVIVFVTNYIEYAPEGYEVQAFRYIMKKDIDKKLHNCLKLAIDKLLVSREVLKINISGGSIALPINSILYIESQLRVVFIYVQKGTGVKQYRCYAAISELEKQLEPQGFLRIHRSFLVNMRHLKKYQCKEAVLSNGTILKVSEQSYSQQKHKYLLWKGL